MTGFWQRLIDPHNDRSARKAAKAHKAASSSNLASSTSSSSAPALSRPSRPSTSGNGQSSRHGDHAKADHPPLPQLPPGLLPSDHFDLHESFAHDSSVGDAPGLSYAKSSATLRQRATQQQHTDRGGLSPYSRSTDRPSPILRNPSHASGSPRPNGLVGFVPEELELDDSASGSSRDREFAKYGGGGSGAGPFASAEQRTRQRELYLEKEQQRLNRERELLERERAAIGAGGGGGGFGANLGRGSGGGEGGTYEEAISARMMRLGSTGSAGQLSSVSGMSGVKGWGGSSSGGRDVWDAAPFSQWDDEKPRLKVLVVGSGFGGLAASIACARQGYSVTLIERGSGLSPHGDLLTFGANATRLFARWGIWSDMWKRSAHGGWWLLKDKDGNDLGGQDLRDFPAVYGATIMQGHRAQYLANLGVEARMLGVAFKPNTEVLEYHDSEKQPSLVTARGETMFADCIVIADGVNSYGRAYLGPELGGALDDKLRDKPQGEVEKDEDEGKKYSVHRAAMSADRLRENPKTAYFLDGCMRTFLGDDCHLKIAPLDNNKQVSFTFLSRSKYTASTNWRDRRPVAEVTDRLKADGWDESVIEAVSAFRTALNWSVTEDKAAERWVTDSGKIVLIGDAVHALSPLSFQGGSQAVEDGAGLAVCLALAGGTSADVPRALRTFENLRKDRVNEAQERGSAQRKGWHGWFQSRAPADLDLYITVAYNFDAEMNTVASFERTCQRTVEGEQDWRIDPANKKECLRRLEIGGRAQREAEDEMACGDLWERGGEKPRH